MDFQTLSPDYLALFFMSLSGVILMLSILSFYYTRDKTMTDHVSMYVSIGITSLYIYIVFSVFRQEFNFSSLPILHALQMFYKR